MTYLAYGIICCLCSKCAVLIKHAYFTGGKQAVLQDFITAKVEADAPAANTSVLEVKNEIRFVTKLVTEENLRVTSCWCATLDFEDKVCQKFGALYKSHSL